MTPKKAVKSRREAAPQLYPYQRRWVEDESRFKIACKARQIGFSFAAAWRVVDRRLETPGLTVWLSASERQALEAMEHVRRFCRELKAIALFEDEVVAGTEIKQHMMRLGNGSRIIALPANPDTVRGFAGDVVLDEFAFHRDADAIWRAAFATATRGFQIEVISTPNGARGKYYELARSAGLVDSELASAAFPDSLWSPHRVDLPTARAQGFVVDVESLRAAIADEDAWQQEYCCRFLAEAAHYIPPQLVVAAEHSAATATLPSLAEALRGPCYLGVDIGRQRDLTVFWLIEAEDFSRTLGTPDARRFVTRAVLALERQPFARQREALDALLALRATDENRTTGSSYAIKRCAIDATGLGSMLAEELHARWGARVEPVVFTAAIKEDLAVRVKRFLEERRLKLPYDAAVRAALAAVKRTVTPAGNIRFDADRTERAAHADHFWALALALAAAEEPALSVDFISTSMSRPSSHASAF